MAFRLRNPKKTVQARPLPAGFTHSFFPSVLLNVQFGWSLVLKYVCLLLGFRDTIGNSGGLPD